MHAEHWTKAIAGLGHGHSLRLLQPTLMLGYKWKKLQLGSRTKWMPPVCEKQMPPVCEKQLQQYPKQKDKNTTTPLIDHITFPTHALKLYIIA